MTDQPFAFFEFSGTHFAPTEINVSPWNGNGQSRVALAGLAAHVIAGVPGSIDMHTARITIDILGLVPRVPVESRVRIVREGRRIQLIEAELLADNRVCVRATALRNRIALTPEAHPLLTRPLPDPTQAAGMVPWAIMHRLQGRLLDAMMANWPAPRASTLSTIPPVCATLRGR